MVSIHDKWIRIFDIPDISKHKNGFTIYKVVSMLYPEACPDAITKVTVWKRFNDFKKLHRELKVLHRKLNLKNKYPNLPTKTLFKRVDEETIRERRQSILNFLEFVGTNSQLFTSNEFVKFLEISHTPVEHLTSNINTIRAELHLPEDPEVCTNLSTNSDDEKTISDTDSITTMSSLSPSIQADFFPEPDNHKYSGHSKLKKLNSSISINSHTSLKNSDSLSITTILDSITLLDGQIYPTPPNTPGSSIAGDHMQYLIDASVHINLAAELETDKKYDEAFTAYKTAIDILLKYGKDDPNYNRRQMIRYKTEKYLIKAEKIYNMYLAPEIKNLQLVIDIPEQPIVKRPLSDLYKFKVVKIILSGMLVLHSESQQLFYIKVIHKTMEFLNEHLILPENVPYMVKLQNHYNCENALFLVLEFCRCLCLHLYDDYCIYKDTNLYIKIDIGMVYDLKFLFKYPLKHNSGTKVNEYLKNQASSDEVFSNKEDQILKQLQDISDNDSELSFSDLINEYTNNRIRRSKTQEVERDSISSDDSFEKIDIEDLLPNNKKVIKNIIDQPLKGQCEVQDLLFQSQKLLSSIDTALTEKFKKNDSVKEDINEMVKKSTKSESEANSSQRKFSEMSSFDIEDSDRFFILPEKTVVRWAAQLLLAVEKLHALGVICRDLQMKNLLIDDKGDLVLTYMCNVKDLCDLFSNGVNHNLAPEVYSFHKISTAVDWWCYGAILYELLVGMSLSDVHPNGLTSFSHLKLPKYVSPEGRSILRQLLTYEPHDRLGSGINGTENIRSHPFFHSVSWESLLATFH